MSEQSSSINEKVLELRETLKEKLVTLTLPAEYLIDVAWICRAERMERKVRGIPTYGSVSDAAINAFVDGVHFKLTGQHDDNTPVEWHYREGQPW